MTCGRSPVPTFFLQRVLRRLTLRHVYYPVHVEAYLLRVRRPVLVAETVCVLAILVRIEGVVAGADGGLVYLIVALGLLYLQLFIPYQCLPLSIFSRVIVPRSQCQDSHFRQILYRPLER